MDDMEGCPDGRCGACGECEHAEMGRRAALRGAAHLEAFLADVERGKQLYREWEALQRRERRTRRDGE